MHASAYASSADLGASRAFQRALVANRGTAAALQRQYSSIGDRIKMRSLVPQRIFYLR